MSDNIINNIAENRIELGLILWESIQNNKMLFLSTIPLFTAYYFQDIIFTRSLAKVTSDIPDFVKDIDINKLLGVMLPYIVALILFYISNVLSTQTIAKIELETVSKLTDKLIESIKTSKQPINVNELMIHIKKIYETKNIYHIVVNYIIPTFIVAFGLIYNFIQNDGTSSIIVIILIIVLIIVTMKLEIDSITSAYNVEEASNNLFDEIHEVMVNIDSVITSDTKEYEMKNVNDKVDISYDKAYINELNNNNTTYGLQLFNIMLMLCINYLSYNLYSQGKIDVSMFTSTVLMTILLMDYYNYCIHAIGDLIDNLGRYSETRNYFNEFIIGNASEKKDLRHITLKTTAGEIIFKNMSLIYESKTVFDKFNLKIRGGTVTGLIGPIGSGKSTLMKMLAGIIDYEGEILIDGQNLKNCTYESIVEHIAYIPQHPKLFNRSVYYNINYGSSYSKEEIINKLNKLGLAPFINSLGQKLDTIAGKEGSKLSGGQKQFVALIRAIIQNKTILLLDEPSSSLDATNKELLMHLIKNIKDKTIIISTHDKQIMALFDRVVDLGKPDSMIEKKSKPMYTQDQYNIDIY
jgi:ABC-type multidrug transport system fused ATPase/permease subunit